MRTGTPPQPTPAEPSLYRIRLIWIVLAANLCIPWGLTQLPLPHFVLPQLDPQTLANLAYGLGISLSAAALLVRRRWPGLPQPARYFQAVLISSILAESIAWLGFAAWLSDSQTPALQTLLVMAAVVFWLIRPCEAAP